MNKIKFIEMAENIIESYIRSYNVQQNHAIPCTIYPVWLSNNPNRPNGIFSTSLRKDIYYECTYDTTSHMLVLQVFAESDKIQKEVLISE